MTRKLPKLCTFFVVLQNLDTLVTLFTFNDVFLFKWLNVGNSMRPSYYVIMFYVKLPLVSPVAYKFFFIKDRIKLFYPLLFHLHQLIMTVSQVK